VSTPQCNWFGVSNCCCWGGRRESQAFAIGRGLVVGRWKREAWFNLNKKESLLVYPLICVDDIIHKE